MMDDGKKSRETKMMMIFPFIQRDGPLSSMNWPFFFSSTCYLPSHLTIRVNATNEAVHQQSAMTKRRPGCNIPPQTDVSSHSWARRSTDQE